MVTITSMKTVSFETSAMECENPDFWVCQNVLICRKSGFLGMSKRVSLSKIGIFVYVKTCMFVENPEFWVCQNVFFVENPGFRVCQNVLLCRKFGFLGMSKRVCLSKIWILGYVKTCVFVENPD